MFTLLLRRHQVLLRHLGDWCSLPSATATKRSLPMCLLAASTNRKTAVASVSRHSWTTGLGQVPHRSSHLSRVVERGAYDERPNQHVKGSDVHSVELLADGRLVSVKWGDGKESKFHSVWLRFNCFCPECRMDHSSQPKMKYDQVTVASRLTSAADDGEGCLVAEWKEDPGHTGVFPLKFLKAHCYSKESLQSRRNSIRMPFSKDMVIPRVSYDEVMSSRQGVYKWVTSLNQTGISIVDDVPCKKDAMKPLCLRIAGCLQHTVYGETFDVVTDDRPINAAYASGELKLHMDQAMYEAPPGLQALHCIRFDERIKGGDNLFVDVSHVAEVFREKHPEDFHLLTREPIAFQDIHYDREWPIHMRTQKPMFRVNKYGDLIGVVWHPHIMGPLQVEEELVEPVYEALGKFYSLIKNFPYQYQIRLKPGEMVIFNNRRISHGRSAFNEGGDRYLQGCYVEISEFKSCVHVLSNLEGDGSWPIRVGDNDFI